LTRAEQGRTPDDLARDIVAQYLEDQSRFIEAVRSGEDALDRGEYLTHEEVGKRLQRFLRP
jgi:predicted transcriptional regulator